MSNWFWHPCTKGHPDPEHCSECTPPMEQRCPETFGDKICRVLGPHTRHSDGMGTAWEIQVWNVAS